MRRPYPRSRWSPNTTFTSVPVPVSKPFTAFHLASVSRSLLGSIAR